MGRFAAAIFAASALVVACAVVHPGHAAEKIAPDTFEKKLQDTRQTIGKERTTPAPSTSNTATDQLIVDICKKNQDLPQCKL